MRRAGGEKGRSSSLEREAEPGEFGNEREGGDGLDGEGGGGETSGKVFSEESPPETDRRLELPRAYRPRSRQREEASPPKSR